MANATDDPGYRKFLERTKQLGNSSFSIFDYDPDKVIDFYMDRSRGSRRRKASRPNPSTRPPLNEEELSNEDDDSLNDEYSLLPDYVHKVTKPTEINTAPSEPTARRRRRRRKGNLKLANLDLDQKVAAPYIFVQNVVVTGQLSTRVNLSELAAMGAHLGFTYVPTKFPAAIRRQANPRSTTMTFSLGTCVNNGSNSEQTAKAAIRDTVKQIRGLTDARGRQRYRSLRLENLTVHNVVGSTVLPFHVDLPLFAKFPFVRYAKRIFDGAVVSVEEILNNGPNSNVKALVFSKGQVVIMGSNCKKHIERVYYKLYPYMAQAQLKKGSSEVTTGEMRRFKTDMKAALDPEKAGDVISIDTAFQTTELQNAQAKNGSLQNFCRPSLRDASQHTKNLLALQTIKNRMAHRKEKEELFIAAQSTSETKLIISGRKVHEKPTKLDADGNQLKRIRMMSFEEAKRLESEI